MKSKFTSSKTPLQGYGHIQLQSLAKTPGFNTSSGAGIKMVMLLSVVSLFLISPMRLTAQATFTSVAPGGNWSRTATWTPVGTPTAGSLVFISPLGPVTVNVATAVIADITVDGLLDVSTFLVSGTRVFYLSETGTLLVGGPNNFPSGFSTININSSSYVQYNYEGDQTVTDVTYGNLILTGSGVKTLPGSSMNVSGNFTMSGSASASLTHALNVIGNTTLAGSSVLALGASNMLSNTGTIVLDGGTLRTGTTTGFSETVGLLIVSNTSNIVLGTGAHALTFAPSNNLLWSGATLTVTGWTGTPGASGTAGKLFFGSTAGTLTAAQLAKISFAGFPGTNAILLSTGEVVPASPPVLAVTGTLAHGSSCIGVAALPVTYTITNTGSAASGITVTSDNPQFVVSGAPTTVAGNGGTATFVVTFTPSSGGAKTATVTVASTTGGSNSPASSLTGTGNALPVAGLTSSDADNIICAGDAVTFTATGGTLYEFYIGATSQGAASASATLSTTVLTSGQIVTVKVTSAAGCSATSTGITTTVNELPVAPIITGTPTVNVGSTTLLGSATPGGVWSSGSPSVATVNASTGEVRGVAAGTSLIRYTVTNGNGCSNFGTMLVTVSGVTSIEGIADENGLLIRNHPNPFVTATTMSYSIPSDGRVTLVLRNMTGQIVKTIVNDTEMKGEYSVNIEFSDLQAGVYFATLSLNSNGKELTRTIRLMKGK
jgi:hypothetical protein